MPLMIKLPEESVSPADFGMGSDSPVRRDSFTSTSPTRITESEQTCFLGIQFDDVLLHQFRNGKLDHIPFPDNPRGWHGEQRKLVYELLGMKLLYNANQRIQSDNQDKQ